jgi:phosphoglycolate phosphatase-like HAD superfamily hydrolase
MYELILWDVDATILSTGGVGGEVMRTAMSRIFGPSATRERTFYSGKTDRQIIHDTFPDLTPAALTERLETFKEVYVAEFQRRHSEFVERTHAMPGVVELIKNLHGQILQAPLTGNIAPVARLKLDLLGLLPYFNCDVGAYGDDHEDRVMLPPIAAERASRILGRTVRGEQIVIVGDTPHDIRCGRQNGTRVVAVATGPYKLRELSRHQPDALLPDLSDFDTARAAILGDTAPTPEISGT